MAPPSAPSEAGALRLRLLSAAVMAPAALAVLWLGGWPFALMAAAAGALMYREWHGLSAGGPDRDRGMSWYAGTAACVAGPPFLLLFGANAAIFLGVAAAVLLAILLGVEGSPHPVFRWLGFPYIFLGCLSMAWLRELPVLGLESVIWLFVVVVATDTGAYFTGRALGGPRLAPRISPKKTWAGLAGGIAAAAIGGGLVALAVGDSPWGRVALASGILAVVAQMGDLLISKAKRTFGVKDSSNLIPGHGGLLDRLDGFLAVALLVAIVSVQRGGSALVWP